MRRPELRFALLGALLFVAFGELPQPAGPAAPTGSARDEALLLHEALARGYHHSDPLVKRRLAMNLRFARPDDGRSDAALAREAIALGMHESDLVVRRRLVQKMELLAHGRARLREVDERDLQRQWERHAEALRQPARTRLSLVYAREEAEALALFRQSTARPGDAALLAGAGAPLPFPSELPPLSDEELARLLGPAFARKVGAVPEGRWSAPIRSAHGFHLAFVHERTPAAEPSFAAVAPALREAALAERGQRALDRELSALRARRAPPAEGAP
jgi:hypothetical protein